MATISTNGAKYGIVEAHFNVRKEPEVEKEVIAIVVTQLKISAADVTAESSFVEDLNADSLDHVELIMAFEDHFGLEISDADAEELKTISDVITYIKESLSSSLE